MTHQRKTAGATPANVDAVLQKIKWFQPAFDRVECWIDRPDPELPLTVLNDLCVGDVHLQPAIAQKYGPRWQSHLTLCQPSVAALNELQKALGQRYAHSLTNVEIAWDFGAKHEDLRLVSDFLLGHLYVPYMRDEVVLDHGTTWYWNRRSNASGGKVGRNLVLYADKRSKQFGPHVGRRCVHLECRLHGLGVLAKHGLVSISDLIHFDHLAFWEANIRLLRPKSLAALGRWLGDEASGTMLRKRAHQYRDSHSTNDIFILQNALREDKTLWTILDDVDVRQVFLGSGGRR